MSPTASLAPGAIVANHERYDDNCSLQSSIFSPQSPRDSQGLDYEIGAQDEQQRHGVSVDDARPQVQRQPPDADFALVLADHLLAYPVDRRRQSEKAESHQP